LTTVETMAPLEKRAGKQLRMRAVLNRLGGFKMLCGGILLVQLAWMFTVPPFGGIDEFDHSYRAAAVAHGQWVAPPSVATRGTGAWLEVPSDIVRAAHDECHALHYTGPEDCVGTPQGAYTKIASGAGRYNPIFYAIIGYPALPFSGAAALYVMRLMTILLAWSFFVLALSAIRRWAKGPLPFVAAAVVCTPVMIYSDSIAAPNGVEMMAALAFWASLIGLSAAANAKTDRYLLTVAAISGCSLVTIRSLGPVWCLMIAATVLIAIPVSRNRMGDLLHLRSLRISVGAVAIATVLSEIWILKMGALVIGVADNKPIPLDQKIHYTLQAVPLWLFQSIAAFPLRDQPVPPTVYVTYLIVGLFLLGVAWRHTTGRMRLGLAVTVAAATLFPTLVTLTTIEKYGTSWQGRYGLPYSLGLLLLVGYALDRAGVHLSPRIVGPGLVLFVASQTTAVVWGLSFEQGRSPSVGNPQWLMPQPWMVAVLSAVGAASMIAGAARVRGPQPVDQS
jgi:hypothetical protein